MSSRKRLLEALLLVTCLGASASEHAVLTIAGKEREYARLAPDATHTLRIRGPGELRLFTRAQLPENPTDRAPYGLVLRMNGGAEQKLAFKPVGPAPNASFPDGVPGRPGALRDHSVMLGRGHHSIELWSTGEHPIFLRHRFRPVRETPQDWVTIVPEGEVATQDLVVREAIVPYFRNASRQPFELDVIGPTDLRLLTRLEHGPDMRGRIHYRVQVRVDHQITHTFALTSRRSDIASYLLDDELVPGRAIEMVIPVPAGRHRIQVESIDPDKPTLLARFMLPAEALALTME